MERTPIVCTLGGDAMPARVDEWQSLLEHVTERSPLAGGTRLTFEEDAPVTELARLVHAEHTCCAFFAFAITVDDRGVALEVTAPPEAQALVAELFGAAAAPDDLRSA
jgi:MerR family copper efflux transcriptional regulator